MARVDRGASLWSAALFRTAEGPWDLALDARMQGEHLRLRGSSIPPSGEANKAVVETRVPLSFASALPGAALGQGLRGLLSLLVPGPRRAVITRHLPVRPGRAAAGG